MSYLLEIKNLSVVISDNKRVLVNDVSFGIKSGEAVGVVGESGSGKTLSALSVLNLLARGLNTDSGSINFQGKDLLKISSEEMRDIRGNQIAMIYQDPMTALNPVMKIGEQLMEVLDSHQHLIIDKKQHILNGLAAVGIADPNRAYESYPHEFSGGMRQRVMIAMSLLLSPKLLIADEPTTALDVTIQRQILALVARERRRRQMSMLWITHDLGVVANLVDRVIVMYAGRVVEVGTVEEIFKAPKHPYTAGLLASLPAADNNREKLASIPGVPPKPWQVINNCAFAPRCKSAKDICFSHRPELTSSDASSVACFFPLGDVS
ncbi:MAG: ABC transporter ATP-binding protein [Actinomycetota bacterium]